MTQPCPIPRRRRSSLFGDGRATTVIGGGTIVVPEIADGRRTPRTALLLAKAGLDRRQPTTATRSRSGRRPGRRARRPRRPGRGRARRNVADGEIRGQATVGGNLCAGKGPRCRAATCRAPCSPSARRPLGGLRTGRRRSRSRSSSRIGTAGSSSRLLRRARGVGAFARSSTRTPTTTPRSPSPPPASRTARHGSRSPAPPGHGCATPLRRGGASDPGRCGRCRGRRRHARRRRTRVRLVPGQDPPGARRRALTELQGAA